VGFRADGLVLRGAGGRDLLKSCCFMVKLI